MPSSSVSFSRSGEASSENVSSRSVAVDIRIDVSSIRSNTPTSSLLAVRLPGAILPR